jgi:hypothetical protein
VFTFNELRKIPRSSSRCCDAKRRAGIVALRCSLLQSVAIEEGRMLMTGRSFRVVLMAMGGASLVIVACGTSTPVGQPPAETPSSASAPSVRSPVSINASMVSIVDHAGHQLWNVEQPGQAPKSRADWEVLAEHATQLAAAGALVRVAGTGPQDMTWVASPGWQKWSREMSDAALAALAATEKEDLKALIAANGQLVGTCEGCHKEFKPDLPSEGILHGHAH